MKLCVESELGLRQVLQDPLHGFSQWSQVVSQVLESSAEVSEFSHVTMLVQNIQVGTAHSKLPCPFRILQQQTVEQQKMYSSNVLHTAGCTSPFIHKVKTITEVHGQTVALIRIPSLNGI